MAYIIAIACCDTNLGIGYQGKLQFRIQKDMKFFKNVTSSNYIVMGGRTWRSMGCKPRPGRENCVLTKEKVHVIDYDQKVHFYNNLETLLADVVQFKQKSNVYIIGGQSVYERYLDFCDMVLLTHIHTDFAKADRHFPSKIYQKFSPTFEVAKWLAYDNNSKTNVNAEIILYAKPGINVPISYRNALVKAFNHE